MFGRLKEQRALEDVLDRVLAGKAHAVAITGEPGIGKTTLLRWASRRATDGSWKVLHARAADHERNVAFSVIVEALDDCVGALEQGRLARLGGEAETELACVFPSLPSSARERRVGTQTERYRLHFAVRRLLEELAGNGPVLVALDDLHWADEASLELVAHLLRRPPRAPVLLLAAYRPRYAPGLLLNALEDARREERCDLLELGPMSPSELEELTGATEADARLALHRESGGNPFYAQQLARGSGPGAVDRRRTSPTLGDVDVPEVVRLAIQRELADLSPTASRFVSACAVAGDPFELDLAVAVAALPEQKALDALDEVLARELVRSTQNPQRFEFRHPIVCHAVYNSAKKSWRVAAHQRASAWLASASRSAAAIAPHIERGVMFVDQAAAEVLRAAGDDAAMRAPAAAAHWYAASLRIAGGADAPPERRVELLIATSAALGAEGRLDESRDCAAEALDAIGTDDIERRVQLASQLAQLDAFRGHPQDARRVLLEALASVPLSMPRQRISLRIELALDRWRTGDTAEAFAEARVALDEARSVKDDRLIGTASALVSLAAMQAGRLAEAERHALLAEGVFTALADQEIAVQPDGLVYSVWASGFLGNYQRVTRLAERGLNLPRVNGRAYLFGSLVVVLTDCLLRLGHVEDAERHAEAGLESALLVRMGPHLAWALTVHACVALERDAVKTAISDGERAASLLSVGGPPNANAPFLIPIVLGEAYLAAGVPDRARHHLLAPPALDHLPPRCVAVRLRLLTETEVVTGHLDRARGWAVEAESVAAQQESAETRAHALWARGLCDLAEQAPKDAMDAGRQAATLFDGLGLTLDAAKVRLAVVARSLLAQREHDRAIEVLTGVHVIALRLGATRLARLAIRVPNLSGASALGLPRRPDGLPKLTSRERDVVALIVRGCTNREIADALHLSLRTVETYVSRVLEKWGVRTRAAIAALANVQDPSELSI